MFINLWDNVVPYLQKEGDTPTLVPYLVSSDEPTSAVIVLPGGGYARRADHEGEPIAQWLNSIGITAFVLNYRVAPYRFPVPLLDAERAIRYVRYHAKEWNIRPEAIGILGFSAGGHLASLAGTHFNKSHSAPESEDMFQSQSFPSMPDAIDQMSGRPDLMVLCYPVITMIGNSAHEGSAQNLAGDHPSQQFLSYISTHTQVTKETPPTFLWHTADDQSVPVENSFLFAKALGEAGVPFDLHVYQHGVHGLGLAPDNPHVRSWATQCELWLDNYGFTNKNIHSKTAPQKS